MSFAADMRTFSLKVEAKSKDVFVNSVSAAAASITDGSSLTGAPGQPVQTGQLKASWQTVFESPTSAIIGTNLVYAPFIEEGVSGRGKELTLRSPVGGFHSVALTALNFDRLVENEVARLGQ